MSHSLCSIDELTELEARGFDLEPPDANKRLLVIKIDGQILVYKNSCPHTGVTLNWYSERFLDIDRKYLQCALHGALFRINDGFCVAGPCSGRSLTPVSFKIENRQLIVDL